MNIRSTNVTFQSKYDTRTERMSIRLPVNVKNHIWARATKEGKTATDVVVDILTKAFRGLPPAPKWQPGTTKGPANEKDVFA
jgi:hypothetical protein